MHLDDYGEDLAWSEEDYGEDLAWSEEDYGEDHEDYGEEPAPLSEALREVLRDDLSEASPEELEDALESLLEAMSPAEAFSITKLLEGAVALAVTAWTSEAVGMRTCGPRSTVVARSAFVGFRFPPDVIVLAVRWYLRFGLSYRDVEELLAERGVEVDHVTIYRWVLRFTPLLADAARPCRHALGGGAVALCRFNLPRVGATQQSRLVGL